MLYIKNFPKSLNDKLIKNLTNLSFELAITVNAEIYEEYKVRKELEDIETTSYINLVKSQKKARKYGVFVSDEFIGGDIDKKNVKNIKKWKEEMDEYDQKTFKLKFSNCLYAKLFGIFSFRSCINLSNTDGVCSSFLSINFVSLAT